VTALSALSLVLIDEKPGIKLSRGEIFLSVGWKLETLDSACIVFSFISVRRTVLAAACLKPWKIESLN
jgi:hypothetical protein